MRIEESAKAKQRHASQMSSRHKKEESQPIAESPSLTTSSVDIDTQFENLRIAARIGIKYHDLRQGYYSWLSDFILFTSIVLSLISVYLIAIYPEAHRAWKMTPGFVIGILTALSLVFKFREKYHVHSDLRKRYLRFETYLSNIELRGDIQVDDVALGQQQRNDIEQDEPKILRVLAVMCHNEAVISMDMRERVHKITKPQKFFSRFFDLNATKPDAFPLVSKSN